MLVDDDAPKPWTTLPQAPAGTVLRPRVSNLLDGACRDTPVIAIVAGAGYGKTTALADWCRHLGDERPVAWVDGRMAARAPGGLWHAIWHACRGALVQNRGGFEPSIDAVTSTPGPHRVLKLLASDDRPLVLVLDDLHEVNDRATLESLDLLIAYLPVGTNIVVASRWDPPLRLAGLRIGGKLTELRTCDIAFETSETQRLLDSQRVDVDEPTARRLTDVVDGWPIALRLAASAMAGGADVDHVLGELVSHEGQLAQYLGSEVLDQLPEESRKVLMAVSITDRCHADLAVALTDVADAGVILEGAATETGLFRRVPGEPGWREAHPLARNLLRLELESALGSDVDDLHHRAATWFADRGDWDRAIDHALHDPHSTCLRDIVTQVGLEPLLRSTPMGQQAAARVVRAAPVRWPLGRPLALAVAVLANVDARAASGMSEALRNARFDTPADERLRVVALARVWRNRGRHDLASAMLREVSWDGASTDELVLLRAEQVLSGCDGADHDVIRQHATAVLTQAQTCEADRLVVHLRVALAALALIEGDPRRAREHAHAAALLGIQFGEDLTIPLAEARVIRVATAFELGEEDRLSISRLTPLRSATREGPIHLWLAAANLDLRQRWREGEHPRRLLCEASELLAQIDLEAADPGFVLLVIELEVLLAMAVQDLPRAESAADRLPEKYQGSPEAALLRAQVHRARRAYPQARSELLPAIRGEVAPLWPSTRLRILALDGVLAGLQGSSGTASLEEAVEIAIASGRKLPFLELGADALRVLGARRHALPSDAGLVDEIIAQLEVRSPASLAEPLTQAELKVLQRLASMATLQEIADVLYLSRNTVKTHTSAIYRKLDVDGRRTAVTRGRELGLLRSDIGAPV